MQTIERVLQPRATLVLGVCRAAGPALPQQPFPPQRARTDSRLRNQGIAWALLQLGLRHGLRVGVTS